MHFLAVRTHCAQMGLTQKNMTISSTSSIRNGLHADRGITRSVSVIVPMYNEEESVEQLYVELSATLKEWGRDYELVFINDGSTDETYSILEDLKQNDEAVKAIHFKRNYGQTAAMKAGIDFCQGDVIIPIDGDLQNDPADIPMLVEKLDEGFDVVSGWNLGRRRHSRLMGCDLTTVTLAT